MELFLIMNQVHQLPYLFESKLHSTFSRGFCFVKKLKLKTVIYNHFQFLIKFLVTFGGFIREKPSIVKTAPDFRRY